MRRFASWQIAGIVIILTLFSVGLSGCFQTADASLAPTETSAAPTPTPTIVILPTTADVTVPTAAPAPVESPQAVAQNPTQSGGLLGAGPEATQTAVQATLFAQATDILAGVTQTAAIDQTGTATAQGTGGPTPELGATAAPGQPTVPGINLGTAVPQGTPGAPGSGAAGPITANCIYTVVDGDRIYRIGLRFGFTAQAIAAANGIVNPDLIVLGQQLRIPNCFGVLTPAPTVTVGAGTPTPVPGQVTPVPATGGGRTYIVQEGDTLFAIATRFGVRVTALAQANNITNVNLIYLGQTLVIP